MEFLDFIDQHRDMPLERAEDDRLFELDLQARMECRKKGIDVEWPTGDDRTPAMKLKFRRESVYETPGNLALDGLGDLSRYLPIILDPTDGWMAWLRAIGRDSRYDKPAISIGRRAGKARKIEALKQELKEHLIAARDFAYATNDETGTPELLPRPSQRELAIRLKMKPWDVSRCLKDKESGELRLYWETAADVYRIMKFSAL